MGPTAPRRPFETLRAQIGRVASGEDGTTHVKSNAAVEIVDFGRVAHEMAVLDPHFGIHRRERLVRSAPRAALPPTRRSQ